MSRSRNFGPGYEARRRRRENEGEVYVQIYPRLEKWINQCVRCGARGYKPEMPDDLGWSGHVSRNLKKLFTPLALCDGHCEVCQRNHL